TRVDAVVGDQGEPLRRVKGDEAGIVPQRGARVERGKRPGPRVAGVGADAAARLARERAGLVDRVEALAAGRADEVGRVAGDGGGADRADAPTVGVEGGGEHA